MTRNEWLEHLRNATGPLALDRLDDLQPEPELLELLRELAAPPWPEESLEDIPTEASEPLFAAMLLALLHDEESIPTVIEGLHQAYEDDWEWYIESSQELFGQFGKPALPLLYAEIERVEREPARDPRKPFYYWRLVGTVGAVAQIHRDVRPLVAELAAQRISDRAFDREYAEERSSDVYTMAERLKMMAQVPTRSEIWLDLNLDLDLLELRPAIEEFFERNGPGYESVIYGNRTEYWEATERGPLTPASRQGLIGSYSKLYGQVTSPQEPETDIETETKREPDRGGSWAN